MRKRRIVLKMAKEMGEQLGEKCPPGFNKVRHRYSLSPLESCQIVVEMALE